MSKIKNIFAREILDSRGNPTIEVEVLTEKGYTCSFDVPSGASTGSKEALELRDNDERYGGKGVNKAINNVINIIKPSLIGMEVFNQKKIDEVLIDLDGTNNKSNLGANATLGVSISCLKASALENNEEMFSYLNKREKKVPLGMFNVINGGMHAPNNIDIQEFMIVPKFSTFKEIVRCASEVFSSLKDILKEKELCTSVGDEGGFAPDMVCNKDVLSALVKAIELAGYIPGKNVYLALDVAASSFYNKEKNLYMFENKFISSTELLAYYEEIVKEYPIISIEDPFDENDYEGFRMITSSIGKNIMIVGDDLFVTNKDLLKDGINKGLCNAILIKPNQIGTFYEMLETVLLAKENNYRCIMSHRSGETCDTFIADAAVALNIPFIKSGSICRGERVCKYNRLLKIEETISKTERINI